MNDDLEDIRVTAMVILPAAAVSLEQLAELKTDFVLRLGVGAGATAELVVNGLILAEGDVVQINGQRAFAVGELP